MTTLDDLLAVNPTAANAALACLGTTHTSGQCGVSASSSNAIMRDNNNDSNSRQSEKEKQEQKQKEKAKRKERKQGAAAWQKTKRNVQRGRKITVGDDDLEYLASLFLCARHCRQTQIQSLVQRINTDIDTYHQKLTAEKAETATATATVTVTTRRRTSTRTRTTAAADMDGPPFDFSGGLGAVIETRRRVQRMTEAAIHSYRQEEARMNQMRSSQSGTSNDSSVRQDSEQPLESVVYTQPPQPSQPSQSYHPARRRSVARKPVQAGDECSICLEKLGTNRQLVWCRRRCGNNFHQSCIDGWLESIAQHPERPLATCPTCRVVWMFDNER
ncbi:hypothetical protein PISL3812_05738 [Talaromyces islandicus]|uniref:RING-type domain-containing protein n=1 Tax=Talaromyces islandicus TaxID=28573 RepID=A0A0U1LZF8_TALIS|nr:hypothetical protein PISL3812_05738 [Talaromyces islandicus]